MIENRYLKIFSCIVQTRGKTNTKRGGENYRGDIAGFEANSETIQSPLHLDKMFPRVVSSWWGTDILNSLKSIKYMFQFSVSMVSFVPILYLLVEVLWPTQDRDMESREGLRTVTSFLLMMMIRIKWSSELFWSFFKRYSDNTLFRISNVSTVDGWQWWGREDGLKPYHVDLNTSEEAWSFSGY